MGGEDLPVALRTVAERFGTPGLGLRDHGPRHWKCVALTGLELARRDPRIDLPTVYAFAQLHDSQRVSEFGDAEHGPRAAEIALALIDAPGLPLFERGGERACKLVDAIRDHTGAVKSLDPTVGACWDADRFNLLRVGIEPDVAFMSTQAARGCFENLIAHTRMLIGGEEPAWSEVTTAMCDAVKLGRSAHQAR